MDQDEKPSYSQIKEDLKNSDYDRTFSLWSGDEDEELLDLYLKRKLSNIEISKKLRRTLGSINARLKLHGYPDKNRKNFGTQFADYIKEGVNPITGELLSEDSAWRHPKILEDLEFYVGNQPTKVSKFNQVTYDETNDLIDKERPTFSEIMDQIKKFLPKISDRDADLMRFHYSRSGQKKTLQQTSDEFNISRERVRQIRNKTLMRLRLAIKNRNFTFQKQNHAQSANPLERSENLSKKDAIKYLDDVLTAISTINGFKETRHENVADRKMLSLKYWRFSNRFNDRQIRVISEIYKGKEGVGFSELCEKLEFSIPELQGILGNITLRWRMIDGKNERLWLVKGNRYFPLPQVLEEIVASNKSAHIIQPVVSRETTGAGETLCRNCGIAIDPERLKVSRATNLCTECASKVPFERRKIEEPLGSRDDFRKDRNSWRRTNS